MILDIFSRVRTHSREPIFPPLVPCLKHLITQPSKVMASQRRSLGPQKSCKVAHSNQFRNI